jgi:hypothetical protein
MSVAVSASAGVVEASLEDAMTHVRNWLIAGLALLNGCVIYAIDGSDRDPWDDRDTADWSDSDADADADSDSDTDADTDTSPPVAEGVSMTPDHAEAGDSVLLSVTSTGPIALSNIANVTFSSSVTVYAVVTREDQLQLVVDVDAAATPGPVEVRIQTYDGQDLPLELPFTVEAAGTGDGSDCE